MSFDEPWIDTPLCTSCNDCLKINPLLFLYNEEKQALLGDLTGRYLRPAGGGGGALPGQVHPSGQALESGRARVWTS